MIEFLWHKFDKPIVTICCGSLNWAESNLGTICYKCKKISPGGKRTATSKDMCDNGISLTEEQFEESYN